MTEADQRAFPVGGDRPVEPGLSKREYFAAIALQGLMANSNPEIINRSKAFGRLAVQAADDLIAALNEEKS